MILIEKQEWIDRLVSDAKEVWPEDFDGIEEMFNRCCFAISTDTINQLELFQHKNEFETMDSIRKKTNLFKDAEYVLTKVLDILTEEKVLERKDGGWLCIDDDPDIESPSELLVQAVRKYPSEGAPFQWLARGHGGLVRFIKGQLYGEEVMFPWSSFKLVEEVYDTSNVYGFYSKLAGMVIKRIIEDGFDRKVTMLEVGAGTGNGTRNVFSVIDDKFEKYIFTDISKALLQRAEKKFKKKTPYDFIEYKVYDLGKPIEEQGLSNESADIVMAVNVLHATDNVVDGIRALYSLVKKGGYVVLSELSPPPNGLYRYMELTFGLLSSYNVYEDRDERPDCPIIRPDKWIEFFKKAGFNKVVAVPHKAFAEMDRGGVVIGYKE